MFNENMDKKGQKVWYHLFSDSSVLSTLWLFAYDSCVTELASLNETWLPVSADML